MDSDTHRLFQRVAEKLGWTEHGALETAEEELKKSVQKSRHPATGSYGSKPHRGNDPPLKIWLSDSDSSGKENHVAKGSECPNNALVDSSDDDFDQFLVEKATPKPTSKQSRSAAKKISEQVHVVSSDSDGSFETFLDRVKTPTVKPRKAAGSVDGLKHFIVDSFSSDDDFVFEKKKQPTSKGNPKTPTFLGVPQRVERRPPSQCASPVFLSDSDDEDDNAIATKSTWRTRHTRREPFPLGQVKGQDQKLQSVPRYPSPLAFSPAPKPSSAPPKHRHPKQDGSASSEEEFQSLLDRIKKNQKLGSSSTHASPKQQPEPKVRPPCLSTPSGRGQEEARARAWPPVKGPCVVGTPVQAPSSRPVSQTEPRPTLGSRVAVCKTPGCFLQSLSVPGSTYCRNFKQNKEELTSKLYRLYNTSVFESKLPSDMSVTWNKKLRKTAGYCITGQERGTGKRYARIELSVKVCDSADRLRDTLVHEMCHAATWLINSVRDGHGPFWKIYSRKATLAHPELPMVTRCHSYDINYKFQYQCSRCKNTIGRHSKSLDTQRFVCALCTGQLVLITPSKARGPNPFANFVKENYGSARQELGGQSHAEVMRKLSADFASTRLSQS